MRAEKRLNNEVSWQRRLTAERARYFVPDEAMKQVVGYCHGYALSKTKELSIVVSCAMPDGPRSVISDPNIERCDYKRDFHSLLARAVNARMGRSGDALFRPPPGDDCRLLDQEAMLEAIVEVIVEPVKLGLVRTHKEWPGCQVLPKHWGKRLSFARPDFFDERMPATMSVVPKRPPGFDELSDRELAAKIYSRVKAREAEIQREFEEEGREFLGVKGLRAMVAGEKPVREPEHAKRLPRYRASDPERQAAEAARVREFEQKHALARQQMLARQERLFPEGTYWWRVFSDQPVVTPGAREFFAPP